MSNYLSALKSLTLSFIIVLMFIPSIPGLGQDGIPSYLMQTEWLELNDQKKWDKLIAKHKEADNLLNKSNDLYLQAGALAQESGEEYEKNQKKVIKLEKEAKTIYVSALEEYKSIYFEMHDILEKYIGSAEQGHMAYNEMTYFAEQANNLYKEVKKVETETDKEKLTRANELQLASIEKGLMIFNTSSQEYTNTLAQSNTSGSDEEIILDQELYEKYKKYISDNTIPDPVGAEQLMNKEGDAATFSAFKELWHKYSNEEEFAVYTPEETVSDSVMQTQDEVVDAGEEVTGVQIEEAITTSAINKGSEQFSREQEESQILVQEVKKENTITIAVPQYKPDDKNEFRVQIAASKTPMSLSQIQAIYRGDLSVLEYKEGSYYKYQVKGFKLFTDAQAVCSNTGVNNAYIMAYSGGASVPLGQAVKETRDLEQEVKRSGRLKTIQSIEFSVQIAASRVRLTNSQLQTFYSGNYEVATIFEDGWYKYQVLAEGDLKYALEVLENCGVRKAFLVAYKNGHKIKLYKALNEYKNHLP